MTEKTIKCEPDHTAVRVALWRALHVLVDEAPHVFLDDLGSKIVNQNDWQSRPDMNLEFSKPMRASIVGRARLVEDLLEEHIRRGVDQYIILGAGLDTFAQRRPALASKIDIFEVDSPGSQRWKINRLKSLGWEIQRRLHFVAVNFEERESLWRELERSGFDRTRPAVVVSTGVSMYLTLEANRMALQDLARLAPGSVFAMTFLLELGLLQSAERAT